MNCAWLVLFGIWVNTAYIKEITLVHTTEYRSIQTCQKEKCLPDFVSPYWDNYCNFCYSKKVANGSDRVYQYTLFQNKIVRYYESDGVIDEKVTISEKHQPKDFEKMSRFIRECVEDSTQDAIPAR